MSGSKDRRRSISTAQVKMRALNFSLDQATDAISGFDRFGIDSVIDLGAGSHTIIFKSPFERDCSLAGFSSADADVAVQVIAVAYDRITIQSHVAGVAADADVTLQVIGSDSRFDY